MNGRVRPGNLPHGLVQPGWGFGHPNLCKIEGTSRCADLSSYLCCWAAGTPEWNRANTLYLRTDYQQSLAALKGAPGDAANLQLMGQDYFMLGEYKKASEAFEKAVALDPNNAKLIHWLGRAYGRRAETGNPFSAPGLASKTRQMFEKAVELDPTDKDALGDLLDFYLDAPGFLGGGMHKAEMLAQMILKEDPAEGHYAQGIVADKKKEYDTAEEQFRQGGGAGSAAGGSGAGAGAVSGESRPGERERCVV